MRDPQLRGTRAAIASQVVTFQTTPVPASHLRRRNHYASKSVNKRAAFHVKRIDTSRSYYNS